MVEIPSEVIIGGCFLLLFGVYLVMRWIESTIRFIEGPYESALHKACAEFQRTEEWTKACRIWRGMFEYLTSGVLLHWLPPVRRALDRVHRAKAEEFGLSLRIEIHWIRTKCGLFLVDWETHLLGADGEPLLGADGEAKVITHSRKHALSELAHRVAFGCNPDAVKLRIKNTVGRVAQVVERSQVMTSSDASSG